MLLTEIHIWATTDRDPRPFRVANWALSSSRPDRKKTITLKCFRFDCIENCIHSRSTEAHLKNYLKTSRGSYLNLWRFIIWVLSCDPVILMHMLTILITLLVMETSTMPLRIIRIFIFVFLFRLSKSNQHLFYHQMHWMLALHDAVAWNYSIFLFFNWNKCVKCCELYTTGKLQ